MADSTPIKGQINDQVKSKDGPKRNVVLGPTGRQRLACSNCRKRRKKCDLGFPCGNCSRLKIECNINEEDLRKKRHTSSYVASLEKHVAYLETSLKTLVGRLYPNDENVLDNMMIGDILGNIDSNSKHIDKISPLMSNNEADSKLIPSIDSLNIPLNEKRPLDDAKGQEKKKRHLVKGSLYPDGPVMHKPRPVVSATNSSSSMVTIDSMVSSPSSTSPITYLMNPDTESKQRISDLNTTVIKRPELVDSNSLNSDPKILKALSNFYRCLYPGHFIFLHRESFLYGFFNHAKNDYEDSHYCSTELIYAMCAVGSRLTPDLQGMSDEYYQKSKTAVIDVVFDEQSVAKITTVQALLCLAFYELGKGCNQQAWYFSGLAIRVGYDMGFQLDPKVWYTDDIKGQLTKSELAIRSRIYWGCYIADHFICLMLGRTSTLSVSNSTIPESDELPEVEGTEDFRFVGRHVLQISLPLKNLIILSRIVQIFTSKIFIESDETESKVEYLNRFNSQVYNWRQSLPGFLQWSRTLLRDVDVSTDPTISYFWYYYYIVRLTFNKPFIEDCEESKIVVIEILEDLQTMFNNFKEKFGSYLKATMFQLYACLLAVNCLKKLQELTGITKNESKRWAAQFEFFNNIFYNELYPQYELPKKLQDDTHDDDDQEKQLLNQVNNINYTHDFSLSNEIDDLIKDLFGVAYNPAQPLT